MACRVGGPNLVANSAGFEIYKSVLRKITVEPYDSRLHKYSRILYKSQVLLRYTYVNII